MRASVFAILLLLFVTYISADVYSASTVTPGELPPPLQGGFFDSTINVVQIGSGSGGSLAAVKLSSRLNVLVLEEAGPATWTQARFVPGNENEAYFQPDVEKSMFPKFDGPGFGNYNVLKAAKQISVNSVIGGAMRLSHFAIEWGSSASATREMYNALGNLTEWDPNYIWGYVNDQYFNYVGTNQSSSHGNFGRIRAVQSKQSVFQDAWLANCYKLTNATTSLDFNTINGAINTCGAEPSNVRLDGTRSATENEYLEEELASGNPNLTVIYNAYVTRILFDYDAIGVPTATGVEGLFNGIMFSIRFRPSTLSNGSPNNLDVARRNFHEVLLAAGTIWNTVILQRSGVGDPDLLNRLNIRVVKGNPNVGKHLKEASSTHSLYKTNLSRADIGYYDALPSPLVQSRPGAFVTLNGSNFLLLGTPLDFGFARVLFAITFELDQELEGSINISSTSPGIYPLVDYGWNQNTVNKHALALKWYRDLVFNTSFGAGFNMVELDPGLSTPDSGLANYAKNYLQPVNHLSCTTRMALDETDGVVDTSFRVFGVNKLRVISQSVLRYVPGAGGQTWTVAIAHNYVNKVFGELGLPLL